MVNDSVPRHCHAAAEFKVRTMAVCGTWDPDAAASFALSRSPPTVLGGSVLRTAKSLGFCPCTMYRRVLKAKAASASIAFGST